uniref:CD209 antigen-like protein D n=1 Tax=Sinocyclocheilus anshuiensis TaxID=1608454 RepID=A0A671KLD5_9TELE
MYVKLCNFGKYTEGKSEPKPLQPDSGDECCDCTSLDFRYLTVHVTTNVSYFSPDTSLDIRRKLRVYRIVSLVLFVICVLLLIVVLVLFMKLTGTPPCQEVEQTTRSLSEQKCSLERCQELYQLPQRLCSDCGKGWLRFENTCYFLSQNRLTWQQSREECQRKGGDLAVITNERVQMYLSMKGNLHYWIGLSHLGTNEWTWINNAVLTARYWGDVSFPGQCAILAGNEPPERSWRPYSCNLYLQYICQKM